LGSIDDCAVEQDQHVHLTDERDEVRVDADEIGVRLDRLLQTLQEGLMVRRRSATAADDARGLGDGGDLACEAGGFVAAARVAAPGNGKHATGYAVDIEGDNHGISTLCKGLGATLAFDEASHVHVEFKNGVAG
jgi:hypothetical protein